VQERLRAEHVNVVLDIGADLTHRALGLSKYCSSARFVCMTTWFNEQSCLMPRTAMPRVPRRAPVCCNKYQRNNDAGQHVELHRLARRGEPSRKHVSDNPINMVHDQLPQHPATQQATCCQHSLLPGTWHCSSCCTASNRVRKCTVQKNAACMLQPLSEERYQVSLCVTHCAPGGKHQMQVMAARHECTCICTPITR
jgi:hypothetical protein